MHRRASTLATCAVVVLALAGRAQAADPDWSGKTLPAGVTQSQITVDGIATRLYQAGDARSREAVVFLHGYPGGAFEWTHYVAEAGRFGRAVAFDMPGFGEAAKPADFPYSIPGGAKWLADALAALGIDRVDLVAHDFGGPWGLEWAKNHPDQLLSVVLLNTGVFENYYGHPYAYAYNVPGLGEELMASETHDTFTLQMQAGNPRPLPQELIDELWAENDDASRAAALKLYRSFGSPDAASNMGAAQAAELRKRTRPALVIWGAADPYVPAYLAYEQSDAFPGADVHLLDSAHWPFVDNLAAVDALAVPFWQHNVHDVRGAARTPAGRDRRAAFATAPLAGTGARTDRIAAEPPATTLAVVDHTPISYKVLQPGAVVLSADRQQVGTVRHVLADEKADIFDGLVIDTDHGVRFVDAPEVGVLHADHVHIDIPADAVAQLPEPARNPAVMENHGVEDTEGALQAKLHRAWDYISGNY